MVIEGIFSINNNFFLLPVLSAGLTECVAAILKDTSAIVFLSPLSSCHGSESSNILW